MSLILTNQDTRKENEDKLMDNLGGQPCTVMSSRTTNFHQTFKDIKSTLTDEPNCDIKAEIPGGSKLSGRRHLPQPIINTKRIGDAFFNIKEKLGKTKCKRLKSA